MSDTLLHKKCFIHTPNPQFSLSPPSSHQYFIKHQFVSESFSAHLNILYLCNTPLMHL